MPAILPHSSTDCFCEPGPGSGGPGAFCRVLPPGARVELCELNVTYPDPPYHIFIHSGEHTLSVCALEKWVDSTTPAAQRRAKTDFVLIGPNPRDSGQVFVVFLEMRSVLSSGDEVRQKVIQCKGAIDLLCKCRANYLNFHADPEVQHWTGAPAGLPNHRVAAAIVPALASSPRCLATRVYSFVCETTTWNIPIVPLSYHWFQKETTTWEQVLYAMGLI